MFLSPRARLQQGAQRRSSAGALVGDLKPAIVDLLWNAKPKMQLSTSTVLRKLQKRYHQSSAAFWKVGRL